MSHRTLASILVLAGLTAPAAAQSDDALRQELAGIRSSLNQIVRLMEARLEREERSLLLRRIEIKNDRLLPVEKAFRDASDNRRHLESEELRMRMYVDELERTIFEDETAPETEAARIERDQAEKELERVSGAQWAVEQQLQDLEVERDDLQDEISSLEAKLDRLSPPTPLPSAAPPERDRRR